MFSKTTLLSSPIICLFFDVFALDRMAVAAGADRCFSVAVFR